MIRKYLHHPAVVFIILFGLVTLLTLLARAFLPAAFSQEAPSDYVNYYRPVAEALLQGERFKDLGEFAFLYPPGYPLLIALSLWLSSSLRLDPGLVQHFFSITFISGAAFVLYLITKRLVGEKWWAWIPAFALITYPFVVWLGLQANSEIPFMFFLYFGFWLILRKPIKIVHGLLAGLAVGMAMLIRPIAIGLGVVLAACMLVLRTEGFTKRLLLAGAILLGNLLVVLPWEVIAYQATGQIIPLSTSAQRGILDGLTFAVDKLHYREPQNVPEGVRKLMLSIQSDREGLQTMGDTLRYLWVKTLTDPQAMLGLVTLKAARSWYGTDSGALEKIILIIQIPYILISGLAIFCAIRLEHHYLRLTIFTSFVLTYFWVMTISGLSILRYMVPAMGLMFVLWSAIPSFFSILFNGKKEGGSGPKAYSALF